MSSKKMPGNKRKGGQDKKHQKQQLQQSMQEETKGIGNLDHSGPALKSNQKHGGKNADKQVAA